MQIRLATLDDIPSIKKIAEETWPAAYAGVINGNQISFMLQDMYSTEALSRKFEDGHTFLLAESAEEPVGFASYYLSEEVIRISKLYVSPQAQGAGIGKQLLNAIADKRREIGAIALELNVNRNNPSVQFYLKMGFEIIKEEDITYFEYVLNDYVMRKEIV